jgi:hypothetical protein
MFKEKISQEEKVVVTGEGALWLGEPQTELPVLGGEAR